MEKELTIKEVCERFCEAIEERDSREAWRLIELADDMGLRVVEMFLVFNETFPIDDAWEDYASTELRAITRRL